MHNLHRYRIWESLKEVLLGNYSAFCDTIVL